MNLDKRDLETIDKELGDLCKEIGDFIEKESKAFDKGKIEVKGLHDYVSYVDKTSESRLVENLGKILPKSGFLAEEGIANRQGERYEWIIDPLDGTTNFMHSIPMYAISIALQDKKLNETILASVYHISLKDNYHAYKDGACFCGDREIFVSKEANLEASLCATGFPFCNFEHLEQYTAFLKHLMLHTSGIRRLGSAAMDLAYVACGKCDFFYEYGLKPWDVAAGAFLVQMAGGKVSDFGGGKNFVFGKEIIASNAALNEQLMELIEQFLR